MKTMECKIVKQDESFFEHIEGKGQKLPLFGRGHQTWYRLVDGKDKLPDGKYWISRYTLVKSFMDGDERVYNECHIQDVEANQLLNGDVLVVDEDHIVADKRSKLFRNLKSPSYDWSGKI
jgi:hypothetical protein